MSDINTYANDLLLDFLDSVHHEIKSTLRKHMGDDWTKLGIERHIGKGYVDRIKEMLNSPMRVVDMGKADEELYGIEHLGNIIDGNWKFFSERLVDRERTKVYCKEIAELRHNVSHRRKHHYLRRDELLRFTQNCRMILSAIDSPMSERFLRVIDSISAGGTPWGSPLVGSLPA